MFSVNVRKWFYHTPYSNGHAPDKYHQILGELKNESNKNFVLKIYTRTKDNGVWYRVENPIWFKDIDYKFILEPKTNTSDENNYDYTKEWSKVQSFAKDRGVSVPDLPKPIDPLEQRAREILAVELERSNFQNMADSLRKKDKTVWPIAVKAVMRALREG